VDIFCREKQTQALFCITIPSYSTKMPAPLQNIGQASTNQSQSVCQICCVACSEKSHKDKSLWENPVAKALLVVTCQSLVAQFGQGGSDTRMYKNKVSSVVGHDDSWPATVPSVVPTGHCSRSLHSQSQPAHFCVNA